MKNRIPSRFYLTPTYRRKIVYNQYKTDLRDILKQLCSYKGVEILERHLMPDHVHMLVSIPPKINVSSFMGYLKGKSALMMFDRHANLKYKFGNRHFWSEGYYVSTVGLNEATRFTGGATVRKRNWKEIVGFALFVKVCMVFCIV